MLNRVIIMGRLTKDPELRYTQTETAVASFRIAVDRDVKSKDGERKTDFIDCVAWRKTGEFVSNYFHKGSVAIVSGRLEIREWTDKDGNRRTSAEINAENVYFGEAKPGSRKIEEVPSDATYGRFVDMEEDSGDLPF